MIKNRSLKLCQRHHKWLLRAFPGGSSIVVLLETDKLYIVFIQDFKEVEEVLDGAVDPLSARPLPPW
ncbi:MAG TPA: hypothetical protein P5523_05755 [Bacteroidales bacterium]|nr:hypothetical protein [Acetomicrobium sp.]HRT84126.1 hypothetical protein [Bacteroidales bacterium]